MYYSWLSIPHAGCHVPLSLIMEESEPYIPNIARSFGRERALYQQQIGYENKDRKNQRGLMVPAFPDQGLIIQACPDQSHSVNSRPHSNPRAHCRRDYSGSGAAAREFTALCKRSGAKQFKFLSCFPKSSGPCSLVWLRDEGARHIL